MPRNIRLRHSIGVAVWLLSIVFLIPISTVRAAGIVGNGTALSCSESSLDTALAGGGLIIFNCGGAATIAITTEKIIALDTTLDGIGQITLSATSANPTTRLFNVQAGALLALQNLTITGGDAGIGNGGAILNAGTTQLSNVVLSSNQAQQGGAIYNSATLTLNAVTISGSHAQLGGAIYNAPPAVPPPTSSFPVQLVNVTLSNNTGTNGGGAIYNDLGSISLLNSTLTNNSADGGGNALVNGPSPLGDPGTIMVQNTILGPGTLGDTCVGTIDSAGGNIDTNNTCGFTDPTDPSDQVNIDPQLGPLQNNGGLTPTHALLLNSPAIDSISKCGNWSDQRGILRPKHIACDSGAYEYNNITTSVLALPFTSSFLFGQESTSGIASITFGNTSIATPATLEYIPHDTPFHSLPFGRKSVSGFELHAYTEPSPFSTVQLAATPLEPSIPVTITINYQNLPIR